MADAAYTVGTSSMQIAFPNPGRRSIVIQNLHTANVLYVRKREPAVLSLGIKLVPGGSLEIGTTNYYAGGLWAISNAAGTTVLVDEVSGYAY